MAITYGFYNSINKDRLYDATQFSQIFDGVINDGVYMSVLNHFTVRENSGMTVIVGGGRAWFNHTWTYNDSDYQLLIDDAEIAAKRIDAIVLKVNTQDAGRVNTIEVIKGVPAATDPQKPTFPDGSGIYYHPLAYVNLNAGVTTITSAMIENCIGVDPRTPFVTGIIETVSAEELLTQWDAEWTDWNNEHRQAYLDWVAQQESDMETWTATQQQAYLDWVAEQEQAYEDWVEAEEGAYDAWVANQQSLFLAWLDRMKGQLSEDAAGHLQLEIDDLSDDVDDRLEAMDDAIYVREFKRYYDICTRTTVFNNDGSITMTNSDETVTVTTVFNNNGTITETVVDGVKNVTYTKTITFNNDGSISETYTTSQGGNNGG